MDILHPIHHELLFVTVSYFFLNWNTRTHTNMKPRKPIKDIKTYCISSENITCRTYFISKMFYKEYSLDKWNIDMYAN